MIVVDSFLAYKFECKDADVTPSNFIEFCDRLCYQFVHGKDESVPMQTRSTSSKPPPVNKVSFILENDEIDKN